MKGESDFPCNDKIKVMSSKYPGSCVDVPLILGTPGVWWMDMNAAMLVVRFG